jgi:4-amino-4-deoxy-L-arabinose transferase-like glycosyltransferase
MKAFLQRYGVILMLGWVVAAGLWLSATNSATTDEMIHTASGYLALTRGDHRFDPEHPFLFKYLTAAPLVVLRPNLPADDQELWQLAKPTAYDSWQQSRRWTEEWLYTSGNNAQLMVFLARLAGVASLAALCWLTYMLGTEWFGERMGRWALFFAGFNPTFLAHAATSNDDVPLATMALLALWAMWAYYKRPSPRAAAVVGLAVAAATCVKFSGIALAPIAVVWMWYSCRAKKIDWKHALGGTLVAALVGYVLVWASYFFMSPTDFTSAVPSDEAYVIEQVSANFTRHGFTIEQFSRIAHWVFPSAFLKGMAFSLGSSYFGRATYIWGHGLGSGVWYYFPVLFLLKTQIIALVLGAIGLGLAYKKRKISPQTGMLLLTGGAIAFLSIRSKLDLGIRHITPVLVILNFGLAAVAAWAVERRRWLGAGIAVLYVAPVFMQMRNLIGFSNAIIWDKNDSYWYFNDSNLDWGQQAERVGTYVKAHPEIGTLYTNFGWSPYSVGYFAKPTPVSNFDQKGPLNGYYLITATQLSLGEYSRFRDAKPYAVIDDATFVYSFKDSVSLVP